MSKIISREDFVAATEAVWSEIQYQNQLERRTDDEAKDVPGFLTLMRRYIRQTEDNWADQPSTVQVDGKLQVTDGLHGLRKIAGIAIRAMVYNGILHRV